MTSTGSGPWFVLGAALLWGTAGTAQAFAPAGYDPKVIGALRLLIGGFALLLLALKQRELGKPKDWELLPLILETLVDVVGTGIPAMECKVVAHSYN